MLRNIAILAALVVAGPAFGQVSHLGSEVPEMREGSPVQAGSVTYSDCQRHYGSFEARNGMQPSARRNALDACISRVALRALEDQMETAPREQVAKGR